MKSLLKFLLNIQFFADSVEGENNPDQQERKEDQSSEEQNPADVYLDTIKELKENTVPKEEYEKIKKERDTLVRNVIDSSVLNETTESIDVNSDERIKSLREKIFGKKPISNYEYMEAALELRRAIKERTGRDVFLPENPTAEEENQAEKFVSYAKEALELTKENPDLFPYIFTSGLRDDPAVLASLAQKRNESKGEK